MSPSCKLDKRGVDRLDGQAGHVRADLSRRLLAVLSQDPKDQDLAGVKGCRHGSENLGGDSPDDCDVADQANENDQLVVPRHGRVAGLNLLAAMRPEGLLDGPGEFSRVHAFLASK